MRLPPHTVFFLCTANSAGSQTLSRQVMAEAGINLGYQHNEGLTLPRASDLGAEAPVSTVSPLCRDPSYWHLDEDRMPFDMRPLFQAMLALWALVHSLRTFSGDPLVIISSIVGLRMAMLIFFLAGVSEGFGTRAVVLFFNRLGRRTFVTSLIVTGTIFVLGAMVWSASIWLLGVTLFDDQRPLEAVIPAVGIGYLPLLFGFLAFAPYLGPFLRQLLQVASLILVVAALSSGESTMVESAVIAVGGWLILQLLHWLAAGPTTLLSRWIQRRLLGREVVTDLNRILTETPLGLRAVGEGPQEPGRP